MRESIACTCRQAHWLRAMLAAWLLASCHAALAQTPEPSVLTMVEFHHAAWNHYFSSAFSADIDALDSGAIPGWSRTGSTFRVWSVQTGQRVALCRFFSTAFAPQSSHFYGSSEAECAEVARNPDWQFEAVAGWVDVPTAQGTCAEGAVALYRLYNGGAGGSPNHRYTTDPTVRMKMIGEGWTPEGVGAGVVACVPAESSSVAATPLGQVVSSSITSRQTGQTYQLRIFLPPKYSATTGSEAIIYAMDMETRFDNLMNALLQDHTDAILVGISYNTSDRRFVDFAMPGAEPYYHFLTAELIPSIESRFRADPQRRTLSGHSLSGLMVMYALFLEQPTARYFSSFIAADASIWLQASQLRDLDEMTYAKSAQLPATLLMPADYTGNLASVLPLCSELRMRHYIGLQMTLWSYSLGHVPMDVPSFRDAISIIFDAPRAIVGNENPCT
ncbi:MAG TPA: alpha/beta hydrolase-fold protein [Casimicrobiaceae bacterium]|nr:alpha/beta hydrolase-fold protein [Casimicrobiaceae bacterium]